MSRHYDHVYSLAFSPNDRTLAAGYGNCDVRFYDIASGQPLHTLTSEKNWITATVFSPDGQSLAVLTEYGKFVRIWDVHTGQPRLEIRHPVGQHAAAFSPDGNYLATGGYGREEDYGIHVWSVPTGKLVKVLRGHENKVVQLAFAPNGRSLASLSRDKTVRLWDVHDLSILPPQPLDLGRNDSVRSLWENLADADAKKVHRAVWNLAAIPKQAVPFLSRKLPPPEAVDTARLTKLVGDLDSDRFATRERATHDLEKMGDPAIPPLLEALEKARTVDSIRRLRELLKRLGPPRTASGDHLRALRAVEALGHIDTPEARALLKRLSEGTSWDPLTRLAADTLRRLSSTTRFVP